MVECLAAQVLCRRSRMALCRRSRWQVKACSTANLPCAVSQDRVMAVGVDVVPLISSCCSGQPAATLSTCCGFAVERAA